VAKEGALAVLAASKPGVHARERDYELELAKTEVARLFEALKEMAVRLTLVEGKGGWVRWPGPPSCGRGHQSRVARVARRGARRRLDAAPGVLELPERRVHRWIARRARGQLADRAPGGSPMHGLLEDEVAEILALFDQWGETDRSDRKLAHRGSYLHRLWVSPSSVRRVPFLADKHFRPLPQPGRSVRKPFPNWVEYNPNSIWIYDTTHFTAARMAALIIEDPVSRKWLATVVSVEETSTRVEIGFTHALDAEGLLEAVEARHDDGLVDLGVDDQTRPILLAVSDNGPR
jgi:hypothetical protein